MGNMSRGKAELDEQCLKHLNIWESEEDEYII